jgi:hypothetical protein
VNIFKEREAQKVSIRKFEESLLSAQNERNGIKLGQQNSPFDGKKLVAAYQPDGSFDLFKSNPAS